MGKLDGNHGCKGGKKSLREVKADHKLNGNWTNNAMNGTISHGRSSHFGTTLSIFYRKSLR